MLGKTTNPILQKTEQAIEAKVKPEQKAAFQKIIAAGLKLMYADKMRAGVTKSLKEGGDPAQIVGDGVAKLLGIMMNQSKGTMPMQAAVPAATILLCEGLDFVEQAGVVKVDSNVLATAMQEMNSSFMQLLGVTPEKLQAMMQKAKTSAAPATQPAKPSGLIAAAQGA